MQHQATASLHGPVSAHPFRWLVAILALAVAACGSPGRLGGMESGQQALTAEDLQRVDVPNAYMAVERLRPDWLRSRGPTSPRNPGGNLPAVYVAGIRQQAGLDALRQVRLGDVMEIQYMSAMDATTRYGTDHAGGAIIVVLR